MEENGLSSYYSNEDERVIIGVLISDGTSMMRICADKEDANKVINTALENDGEVLSILTANKAYVLSDYDGTKNYQQKILMRVQRDGTMHMMLPKKM